MGTYYNITFEDKDNVVSQKAIDSVLLVVNLSMSTYIAESTISKFNKSRDSFCFDHFLDPHFNIVFK